MDLVVAKPHPFIHFTLVDRHTKEWELQLESAGRYFSQHLLNLVAVQPPFRLAMRIDWLRDLLPRLEPNTIVILIDAMDVLFNASMDNLVADFGLLTQLLGKDRFGRSTSVVFNGEKNCWPHKDWASLHDPEILSTPFPFLNGGVMLGYKEAFEKILQSFPWNRDTYDQTYWMHVYLESRKNAELPRVEVDNFGRLACCFYKLDLRVLELRHNVVYFRENGIRPALLHFNGPTKVIMPKIARQLGLFVEPKHTTDIPEAGHEQSLGVMVKEGHLGGFFSEGDGGTYYPVMWQHLVEKYNIKSVLDVGCGRGFSAKFFASLGCQIKGIDGSKKAQETNVIASDFILNDYTVKSAIEKGDFDLVWSCEFVEHVEEKFMPNYIRDFQRGKILAMTFAGPNQTGHHHVNCQTKEYWINTMEKNGFRFLPEITHEMRQKAAEDKSQRQSISNLKFVFHFVERGLIFQRS